MTIDHSLDDGKEPEPGLPDTAFGLPNTAHGKRQAYVYEKAEPSLAKFTGRLSPEFKNFLNPFECWVFEIFLGWAALRKPETLESQADSLIEECRRHGCPRDSVLTFWKKLWDDVHRDRAKSEEPPERAQPPEAGQSEFWTAQEEPPEPPAEAFAAGEK